MQRSSAFTLVEVLCVVILLGIIAALVSPTLSSQDDTSLSAAARVVIADIQYAQRQAIATGSDTYVKFVPGDQNGSGGSYSIYSDSALSQPVVNPISGRGYTQIFGGSSASWAGRVALTGLDLNGSGNTVLVFDSLGTPSVCPMSNTDAPSLMSGSSTIVLGCGAMSVTVTILPDTGDVTASGIQSQ